MSYVTIETRSIATTVDADLIQTSRVKLNKREKEEDEFIMLSEMDCNEGRSYIYFRGLTS